jgi:hypothetical protein
MPLSLRSMTALGILAAIDRSVSIPTATNYGRFLPGPPPSKKKPPDVQKRREKNKAARAQRRRR